MKSAIRLVTCLIAAIALVSCQHRESSSIPTVPTATDELAPRFAREDLFGVWEVVDYFQNGLNKPETRPNLKYCFAAEHAYPELSPDAVNDSAEGSTDWFIAKTLLIFEGSMGTPPRVFGIQKLEKDTLVLSTDAMNTMTLKRIRKVWNGRAPVLKLRNIPVRGMMPFV